MKYTTDHFGELEINSNGILHFPDGLIGYEVFRHWVLLIEAEESDVGWLQSLDDRALALTVVAPQRFVPQYVLKVDRRELSNLPWGEEDASLVLAVVSQHDGQLTANLKAPLILNLTRGFGRQIVVADEQPLQFALSPEVVRRRKSA